MNRIVRTSLAISSLVVAIALLHLSARFGLRGPTGLSRGELSTWMNDPATVVATVFRWTALLLAYYLTAVVLAVAVFADGLDHSPLGQLVPSGLAASVGLVLGLSAITVPLASHMAESGLDITNQRTTPLALRHIDEPLTLESLDHAHDASVIDHPLGNSATFSPAQTNERDADEIFTVSAGDSLWSIAEETLTDQGHAPNQRDVSTYWRTLISANQDRLVEPNNPDLILPGQQFILPPTP